MLGATGAATVRSRQVAKSVLEKVDFETLTVRKQLGAAKIIRQAHEDNKDKRLRVGDLMVFRRGDQWIARVCT